MASYGKWLVGTLGWAFGGPLGALLGFMLGSAFDAMNSGKFEYKPTQPADFSVSLMVLAAAVMKADGKQMKSELDYIRAFFSSNFGQQQAEERIQLLRDLLKQDIPVNDVCAQIRQNLDLHSRLQLLHFLFGLAQADGQFHPAEISLISDISDMLGINRNDFDSIKAMFVKETDSAYKILGVPQTATDEEIKRAYRQMALKYHPDRVSHLGEDYQKAAKEKFQQLNEAYNTIKKDRGFS